MTPAIEHSMGVTQAEAIVATFGKLIAPVTAMKQKSDSDRDRQRDIATQIRTTGFGTRIENVANRFIVTARIGGTHRHKDIVRAMEQVATAFAAEWFDNMDAKGCYVEWSESFAAVGVDDLRVTFEVELSK